MHDDIDEQTVMAYVDGELPEERRREVARRIDADPALRDLERTFRESRDMLRDAFAGEEGADVPDRLLAVFDEPAEDAAPRPTAEVIDIAGFLRAPAYRRVRQAAAMAACVMLAVGLGVGTMISGLPGPDAGSRQGAPLLAAADPNTYRLLSETPSNEAVAWANADGTATGRLVALSTFQDRGDRYCRQFVQEVSGDATSASPSQIFGIACRGAGGDWSTDFAMVEPVSAGAGGSYMPASGASAEAFANATDAMMAVPPLTPDEEETLLNSWSK